jgi:Flp pilus assembly protein TadG
MMRRLRRHLAKKARAAVAMEFALITVFFLVPLLGGAADFVIVMPAQAQLNTALQALYSMALSNTGASNISTATNTTYTSEIITKINNASVNQLSMPATMTINGTSVANPSLTYVCYTTASATPNFTAPSTSAAACSGTQTTLTLVNYKVSTTVSLPIPIPGIGTSWTLSAQGFIQLASS